MDWTPLIWILIAAGVFVLGAAVYLTWLQLTGNLHVIIPGEMYRSGHLNWDRIVRYRRKHQIASIVNLRGPAPKRDWYRQEVAAAKDQGIEHFDFALSAKHDVTPERAAELVELMKAAPKPILLHCKAGADRTSLAAALYLAGVKGMDEKQARRMISMRFGHVPTHWAGTVAIGRSWKAINEKRDGNA